MRACLNEHTADLSDGCKASMAEHAAKVKEQEKMVSKHRTGNRWSIMQGRSETMPMRVQPLRA